MGENDGAPADPMTAMAEGASSTHELYLSYLGAGFTPEQAMYMTAKVITAFIRQTPGD